MNCRLWMRERRLQLGLTQQQLAKLAMVSEPAVRGLETGLIKRPSVAVAQRLAEVLQVPWTKFHED